MRTELTDRLGLRYPIVQAPMGGAAGPALADAVSAAGALGMITAGPTTSPEELEEDAREARGEHVGIGTLAWRLDAIPEILDVAIAARPAAISISAGPLGRHAARVTDARIPLFVQVPSAEAAREAVEAGADFVVAQGTDAGGHTGSVGTMPLVEAVLAAVGDRVPVLAAGGIASGRGLAGVLAMGCAGAWIGTRFEATREALGSGERKRLLVQARETDTIHTRAFDVAQRLDWPAEFPGRALRNRFTDRWHGREDEIDDEAVAALAEARTRGDFDEAGVYAGGAVGAIDDIPAAGELVERIGRQADELLRRFV